MPTEARPGRYGRQPLKDMIGEAGLTNARTAEAVGVSTNQITMLSNGQTAPSLQLAGRLARLFGVHIEDLFSDSMLGAEEPTKVRRGKRS
jgi:putative transcriptional regulator